VVAVPEQGEQSGEPPARIIAVVVTYNRLQLLQRLLERLDRETALSEVIVVDNASTDGTSDWLAALDDRTGDDDHRTVPVFARTLARNSGGAGGFHDGLELAVERGADLVWLMDDDGLPDPDCLERLLGARTAAGGLDFWGPVVVDEDAPDRLVFPIRLPGSARVVHRLADVTAAARHGLIRDIVIPFNGVLVTRELVERIGYPRAEFFIWGDDHEYRLRAEAAGARIATVVGARVLHPSVGDLGTPMLAGRATYNHSPSDLKHYCMARNNLLNLRDYRGWPYALAFVAKTVWFYLFTKPRPGRLLLSGRAWVAALRGDFTGHEKYLQVSAASRRGRPATTRRSGGRGAAASRPALPPGPPVGEETVAIVVVTYNRAELLARMLDGLARLERLADAVIVVDNASTDATGQVLQESSLPGLRVIRSADNLGGAGGFHLGVRTAYEQGFDRIWLMDDDVIPAPDCLSVLLHQDEDCLMAVREDSRGRLAEYAAVRFDLRNPLAIKPKTASVVDAYPDRASMPERVELANVAFEGFMVRRRVIEAIGLPDPAYFIFYDDADFALRARRAGFRIWAIRDARLVRQLDFSQQHDLSSWKGFYMYRNLFVVHFRYGENAAVRAKPWLIAAGVTVLSPLRGGRKEARNVIRALASARGMARQVQGRPPASVD